MTEFTGERVIPGQVDPDLWNEHYARYAFAADLARTGLVLDLGCGAGYGSAEMARDGVTVVGLDISADAVAYARSNYARRNLGFVRAACAALPFADSAADLVVAFEVIEHLADWAALLREARRVLQPRGRFLVSTPNKHYYAQTRQPVGPNPFHEHEFTFDEFRRELAAVFPHVSLLSQNHVEAIVFQHLEPTGPETRCRLPEESSSPGDSHFFVAICSLAPLDPPRSFVHIPTAANLLAERERHIARLQEELRTKDEWLAKAAGEHASLVELHRAQTADLEKSNRWAENLSQELQAAKARIIELQEELRSEQAAAAEVAAGYDAKVAQLEADCESRAAWARELETRLSAELKLKCDELAQCVALLDTAEKTVQERTEWARALELEKRVLADQLSLVAASRWIKLGRAVGLGPDLRNR